VVVAQILVQWIYHDFNPVIRKNLFANRL